VFLLLRDVLRIPPPLAFLPIRPVCVLSNLAPLVHPFTSRLPTFPFIIIVPGSEPESPLHNWVRCSFFPPPPLTIFFRYVTLSSACSPLFPWGKNFFLPPPLMWYCLPLCVIAARISSFSSLFPPREVMRFSLFLLNLLSPPSRRGKRLH